MLCMHRKFLVYFTLPKSSQVTVSSVSSSVSSFGAALRRRTSSALRPDTGSPRCRSLGAAGEFLRKMVRSCGDSAGDII